MGESLTQGSTLGYLRFLPPGGSGARADWPKSNRGSFDSSAAADSLRMTIHFSRAAHVQGLVQ
jgi:hypothetical protein